MTDSINWKEIDQNSTQALKYVCQQNRVYPIPSNKNDLVRAVTNIRDKKSSTQNSAKTSSHSSTASSREQSPAFRQNLPQFQNNKKTFNLISFLRTPNPIVLTVAFGSLITCLIWIFTHSL